ncbi:uncharacterized protein TTMY_0618 [Thermus thermophilus]|nr:uncharacterized protein TTMY_0618 [Thermus thermophilus]BDB11708.1 hypothetical protein TthTMY_14470 [Thermus thermophilus]
MKKFIKRWPWALLTGLLVGGLAWWMGHKPFPPKPQADQTYRFPTTLSSPPNLPPLLEAVVKPFHGQLRGPGQPLHQQA